MTTTIYPLKLPENTFKYHLAHLETGIKRVKYELLELHPEQECLIKQTCSALLNKIREMKLQKEMFVTLESAPELKWTTLKDKSIFLNKTTLPTKLLQIAVLGLTGKEKDYLPFWNNHSMEISKKLWLPTKIDCQESLTTSSNLPLTCTVPNSWFSMTQVNNLKNKNSLKTLCPSSMSTLVNKWENADIQNQMKKSKKKNTRTKVDKKTPNGVVKIRLLPTIKQQMVFRRWLGGTNATYNNALHSIKSKDSPVDFNVLAFKFAIDTDKYGQRNINVPEKLSFTPSDMRKSILNELVIAYNTAKTNRRLGFIGKYDIDYKRKKNQKSRFSFPVPSTSVKIYIDPEYPDEYRIDICTTKMKECMTNTLRKLKCNHPPSIVEQCRLLQESDCQEDTLDKLFLSIDKKLRKRRFPVEKTKKVKTEQKIQTSVRVARLSRPGRNKTLDSIINCIRYNCRLCYRYGYWYIHIPYVRNEYKEPTNNDTAVALDPGFKTFQTFYSNETCGKYQQDEHRMKRICDMLDYYKWTLNTKWHASKYVKYKTDKLYRKQLHLVEEMHSRIINDITSKYNWIFLPTFETQDMLEGRGYTKGKRDVKRHAYQLCHFKFKERLKHRCQQMKNSKVLIVSEAWTTKTCSGCGWIWSDMTTKDRMFTCKSCKLEIDRDINGARNIMIRTLTG